MRPGDALGDGVDGVAAPAGQSEFGQGVFDLAEHRVGPEGQDPVAVEFRLKRPPVPQGNSVAGRASIGASGGRSTR